jgi:hypothetical protein
MARYIHSTPDFGLHIMPSDMILHGSADAAFAVYDDYRSQTGILLWLGEVNSPIHVAVKKQTLVTRSSAEAEMVTLSSIVEELMWFRWVLEEMNFHNRPLPFSKTTNQSLQCKIKARAKLNEADTSKLNFTTSVI